MEKKLIWRPKVRFAKVSCSRGSCWITWQGGRDIILQAGECLEVRNVRRLCVEFLRDGEGGLETTERTETRGSLFRLPASAEAMRSSARACW
jgi:hypothetical protein